MSDYLHCDINQLVQERFERGETDLAEMTSMLAESLAHLVCAPEADQPSLLAHALSSLRQMFPEKSGVLEGGLERDPLSEPDAPECGALCVLRDGPRDSRPVCTGTRVRMSRPRRRSRTRCQVLRDLDRLGADEK